MISVLRRRSFVTASLLAALIPKAHSAGYPERPLTLVVAYPAGAAVDRAGRTFAYQLEKQLGQSVIVENIAGASGTLGAKRLVRAPADGYTLLMGTNNEVIISPEAMRAGYGVGDFTPVSRLGYDTTVVVANTSFAPNTIDELVKLAKSSMTPMLVGVAGAATMQTFGAALLAEAAGIKFDNVVYKGGAPLINDLIGGQVQVGTISLSSVLPHIQQGRLKALGVISSKRHPSAPQIPTVNESQFVKGVEADLWIGLFAPAKLPAPVLARLAGSMRTVVGDAGYRESEMRAGALVADFMEPADFQRFVLKERERLRPILSNLKMQ